MPAVSQHWGSTQQVKVCGDTVCCKVLAAAVAGGTNSSSSGSSSMQDWFQRAIGTRATLVQQQHATRTARQPQHPAGSTSSSNAATTTSTSTSPSSSSASSSISFANEAQLLLVSEASVAELSRLLQAKEPGTAPLDPLRFRPNLVVAGAPAFAEDAWAGLVVRPALPGSGAESCAGRDDGAGSCCGGGGGVCGVPAGPGVAPAVELSVVGPCGRCEMVQVDQGSGVRDGPGIMRVLAQHRRRQGRLEFGMLLGQAGSGCGGSLSVGDVVAAV
jgi:uncharacterized protein YcbX